MVHYGVDLAARTCVYFGHGGETFEESYPAVSLPDRPHRVSLPIIVGTDD